MELGVEGGVGWYGGLAKMAAAKEGYEGSCPYCSMKGIGEIKCLVKNKEMFHGYRSTEGALIMGAIALHSCMAHGNPVVVTIPWGTIDDVSSLDTSHPGLNHVPSNFAPVLADESAEKQPGCRHPVCFGNVPAIAKLGEAEDPSTIITFSVGSVKEMDGHMHSINEVSRKLCLKITVCLQTVGGVPCK